MGTSRARTSRSTPPPDRSGHAEQHGGEHAEPRTQGLGRSDDGEEAEPGGVEHEHRSLGALDGTVADEDEHGRDERHREVALVVEGHRGHVAEERVAQDAASEPGGRRQDQDAHEVEALADGEGPAGQGEDEHAGEVEDEPERGIEPGEHAGEGTGRAGDLVPWQDAAWRGQAAGEQDRPGGRLVEPVTERIRNVALVGHDGNGKTTLAEALLLRAGVLGRMGTVEAGNTASDTEEEERQRGQSLSLSVLPFPWGDHHVNLIDTPGYADFAGEVEAALRVADLLVFVVDAVAGVQSEDERLWRIAAARGLPRLVFVNKMDRERADFDRVLGEIRERFSPTGIEPVELPVGRESGFHGVADLVTEHVWLYDSGRGEERDELPDDLAQREHLEHEHLVEDVVEQDDSLLERYLEGEQPTAEELERALHDGVRRAVVFPVLVGSAVGPVAVDRLAEFIAHVGPSPAEVPPAVAEAAGEVVEVPCDPDGPPVAFVFKTVTDPYVGQLSMFKVLSGAIAVDDVLVDTRTGEKQRLHGLVRVRGAEHEPPGRASWPATSPL